MRDERGRSSSGWGCEGDFRFREDGEVERGLYDEGGCWWWWDDAGSVG